MIGAAIEQAAPCFLWKACHRRAQMQQGKGVSAGCAEQMDAREYPFRLPIRARLSGADSEFSSACERVEAR